MPVRTHAPGCAKTLNLNNPDLSKVWCCPPCTCSAGYDVGALSATEAAALRVELAEQQRRCRALEKRLVTVKKAHGAAVSCMDDARNEAEKWRDRCGEGWMAGDDTLPWEHRE